MEMKLKLRTSFSTVSISIFWHGITFSIVKYVSSSCRTAERGHLSLQSGSDFLKKIAQNAFTLENETTEMLTESNGKSFSLSNHFHFQ